MENLFKQDIFYSKTVKTLVFGGLFFAVFFILGTVKTEAETICSFSGPDVSSDFLRLTDFSISSNSGLRAGETITVQFKLQNYGQFDINLGKKGIFVSARDPDNSDVSFGFTRANTVLKMGETVSVSSSKILDKAGTWKIWPSYNLLTQKGDKFGPDEWHLCTLQVAPAIQDSDKDAIPDEKDNCPKDYNPQQEDMDNDGIGDACDPCDDRDLDQDGIKNCLDKCPNEPETYNNYQDDDGCPDTVPVTEPPKEEPMPQPKLPVEEPEPLVQQPEPDGQEPEEEQTPTPEPQQQPETQQQEQKTGTPKAIAGTKPGTIILILPATAGAGTRTETINSPTRERVTEGPIMQGAFEDGDGDGVINMIDQCLETPAGKSVFENGCRCRDTDGGRNPWQKSAVFYYKDDGTLLTSEEYCTDGNRIVKERWCTANAERLDITSRISGEDVFCANGCEDGRCKADVMAAITASFELMIPLGACSTGEQTCADGVQNQDETGIDCGGKCAPCNTVCTTPVKFAPPDTPCASHFFGGGAYVNEAGRRTEGVLNASDESRSDQHRIDLQWTDGGGECNCQFYEICDPDLDFVIEEAQQCCSATSMNEVDLMPDPNLCKDALRTANGSCKKCTGLYIIKGLGTYARWMQGYARTRAMDYYICGAWASAAPAERLINYHKTGICRDYSGALITLLRKAGYSQRETGNICDGVHCYNLVKLPGYAKWHVIDTTGNNHDIRLGGLPSSYPYCFALNEANWCFNNTKTFNVDAYQESQRTGTPFAFATCLSSPGFVGEYAGRNFDFDRDYGVECGPGVACSRDNYELPDWAPLISQIVGCESR